MEQSRKLVHHDISQLKRLTQPARRLLLSITFYNIIFPIFSVFINAFLWRLSHNLSLIAVYNLVWYVGMPLGFYCNGLLLQTFQAKKLHTIGLFIFGIFIATLIFQTATSYLAVAIFGLLQGFFAGMYWGNRNFLTIETTTSENRIYFSGIESVSLIITGIIVPLVLGYFITLGDTMHLYTALTAYHLLALFMLVVICVIGIIALGVNKSYQRPHTLILRKPSKVWGKIRWTQFLYGAVGILQSFFPIVLVLYLLGHEDTLGVIQSLSAAITAIIVYAVAKSLSTRHRVKLIITSFVAALVGIGFFCLFYNTTVGIFIYFAAVSFMMPLLWIALHSLNFDVIDKEDIKNQTHYSYLADQEFFLNLGRIFSIGTFLLVLLFFSDTVALRFLPFFLALLHGFLLLLIKKIEKNLSEPTILS